MYNVYEERTERVQCRLKQGSNLIAFSKKSYAGCDLALIGMFRIANSQKTRKAWGKKGILKGKNVRKKLLTKLRI